MHYLDSLRLKHNVPQGGVSIGFRSRETFFKHFLFALETYTTTPDSFATHGKDKEEYWENKNMIVIKNFLTKTNEKCSIFLGI